MKIDPIPAHWEGVRKIAELEARFAIVAELHTTNRVTKCCPTCGRPGPCETLRALVSQ